MSLVTQRQVEFTTAGTFNLNVQDFESVGIYVIGTATAAVDGGILDGSTFVKLIDITNATGTSVSGFSTLNIVVGGTVDADNKVVVYGKINKVSNE